MPVVFRFENLLDDSSIFENNDSLESRMTHLFFVSSRRENLSLKCVAQRINQYKMGCVLRKLNSLKDIGKCVICSCSLGKCSDKVKLICGHTFHRKCIREWFSKTSNNCPLCRKNL